LFGLGAGLAALVAGFFVDLALFLAMKYTSVAPEWEKWGDGKNYRNLRLLPKMPPQVKRAAKRLQHHCESSTSAGQV
jgi:hypothetical protein